MQKKANKAPCNNEAREKLLDRRRRAGRVTDGITGKNRADSRDRSFKNPRCTESSVVVVVVVVVVLLMLKLPDGWLDPKWGRIDNNNGQGRHEGAGRGRAPRAPVQQQPFHGSINPASEQILLALAVFTASYIRTRRFPTPSKAYEEAIPPNGALVFHPRSTRVHPPRTLRPMTRPRKSCSRSQHGWPHKHGGTTTASILCMLHGHLLFLGPPPGLVT